MKVKILRATIANAVFVDVGDVVDIQNEADARRLVLMRKAVEVGVENAGESGESDKDEKVEKKPAKGKKE